MPTSEWKRFKTSGQSTPHELRSVLDQEINKYLIEMRNAGFQLISIERVAPDEIFNDITQWEASSEYRFFWNSPEDIQNSLVEQSPTGTPSTISEDLVKSLRSTLLNDINKSLNEKLNTLYSQMIKEENLTNLEQNIVKSISSELNIKLGVLTNNLRSYIDEQMTSIQTTVQNVSAQIETLSNQSDSKSNIPVEEPPQEKSVVTPEFNEETESDLSYENDVDDSFSDRASIFTRKTTPISEVEYKSDNPNPSENVSQEKDNQLGVTEQVVIEEPPVETPQKEEQQEQITPIRITPVAQSVVEESVVEESVVEESVVEESIEEQDVEQTPAFESDFTKELGLDLDPPNLSSKSSPFETTALEEGFFNEVPIGETRIPNKDFVEEDFGTTIQDILHPELEEDTSSFKESNPETKKAEDSSVIIDDPDM